MQCLMHEMSLYSRTADSLMRSKLLGWIDFHQHTSLSSTVVSCAKRVRSPLVVL